MPRSKASIAKQKATIRAKQKQKRTAQPVCDVRDAIISLRRIRQRMVTELARGALAYPTADHIDALNALQALQGRG